MVPSKNSIPTATTRTAVFLCTGFVKSTSNRRGKRDGRPLRNRRFSHNAPAKTKTKPIARKPGSTRYVTNPRYTLAFSTKNPANAKSRMAKAAHPASAAPAAEIQL